MPTADLNGLELCYESLGADDAPTCLLVMGLGAQLNVWPEGLVTELLDRGFRVVRFDNRDVGLSTKTSGPVPDLASLMAANAAGSCGSSEPLPLLSSPVSRMRLPLSSSVTQTMFASAMAQW